MATKTTGDVTKTSVCSRDVTYWISLPGTFTAFDQGNSSLCGPACVKMVLHYINGTSTTLYQIAAGCGTTSDGTNIIPMQTYLNTYQSTMYYAYADTSSNAQGDMASKITSTVGYDQLPCIIALSFSASGTWPYSTNGSHYVCINALRSDKAYYQLADPWWNQGGMSSAFYQVGSYSLYSAFQTSGIGMLW